MNSVEYTLTSAAAHQKTEQNNCSQLFQNNNNRRNYVTFHKSKKQKAKTNNKSITNLVSLVVQLTAEQHDAPQNTLQKIFDVNLMNEQYDSAFE